MVAPITTLRTVQAGIEATRGTLVPATTILDFVEANWSDDPQIAHIRQGGSLATSHRVIPLHEVIQVNIKGRFTYGWAPWWFNLFLGPLATGTGAGADKTWTFGSSVVSDTTDNLKSASLEIGGKDTWPGEFKLAGVVGQKLHLAMDVNDNNGAWSYEATLLASAVTSGSKTGALSTLSGLNDILVQNTKVYLNSSGTAFGATQKSGVVISCEVDIEVGMTERWTLSGSSLPTRTAITAPRNITGRMIAEWDTLTDRTALLAGTAERLRIEAVGPVLGTQTYKSTIDIPCTMDTLDYGDDNGVITEEVAFTAQYDSTPAADINATIVNASAALP